MSSLRPSVRFLAALTGGVCGAAALLTPVQAAAATAAPALPDTVASSAALGITVDSDGWIHYTKTLVNTLGLQNKTTTTSQGTKVAGGDCTFPATSTTTTGADTYSEEVAFNPLTCQDTVVSGTLTSAGQAKLNAETATTAQAATVATPAVAGAGAHAAFEKVSYVDPADITITSLTDNMKWVSNGRTITQTTSSAVSYKFQWDDWRATALKWTDSGYPFNKTFTKSQVSQTFTNTDFEKLILKLLGPMGLAACGGTTAPAVFVLSPFVEGKPNGTFAVGHSNSVKGGCSDLVHFRENHGTGHSS